MAETEEEKKISEFLKTFEKWLRRIFGLIVGS